MGISAEYLAAGAMAIVAVLIGYTFYLKGEIKAKEGEILEANSYIERQNAAIKALEATPKISNETKEKTETIKYIKVKDGSCEARLEAMEKLFNSAF